MNICSVQRLHSCRHCPSCAPRSRRCTRTTKPPDMRTVIRRLPDLITRIDGVPRIAANEGRRETLCTYVSAYVGTAKLLTKFGGTDLAVLAADRAATIAVEADSLGARGMAAYQVVCAQLRDDHTDEAERLAVRMAETIQRSVTAQTPMLVSVAGALWLIAAVAAARRTDRGAAWARLDAAERLAELLDEDANHAWTAFGPTNVRIHRVSVAAELGDPSEALRAAAQVVRRGWGRVYAVAGRRSLSIWLGRRLSASVMLRRRCTCWKRNALPRRRSSTTPWFPTCCGRCSPARAVRTASCMTCPSVRAYWTKSPPVSEHLALVACAAPLAARVHDVAARAIEVGWIVRVVATPSAMKWVDADRVEELTGCAVLVEQRQPGQAKRFPPPAQVIVCPATFNTVNKLAAGIMDNYATGLLCEALASRPRSLSHPWSTTGCGHTLHGSTTSTCSPEQG
jgi:Flavoprotein